MVSQNLKDALRHVYCESRVDTCSAWSPWIFVEGRAGTYILSTLESIINKSRYQNSVPMHPTRVWNGSFPDQLVRLGSIAPWSELISIAEVKSTRRRDQNRRVSDISSRLSEEDAIELVRILQQCDGIDLSDPSILTKLKVAYWNLSAANDSIAAFLLNDFLEVTEQGALDMIGLMGLLVVEADFLNEHNRTKQRTIIRRSPHLAKLASFEPWNAMLDASPEGEVKLNESLTKEDVAQLCRIYSRFASCISD
jgi:hypothetical protein